jgi:hypothetical protein
MTLYFEDRDYGIILNIRLLLQKLTFPHKVTLNFTYINSLKILECATKQDLLLFMALWYIIAKFEW